MTPEQRDEALDALINIAAKHSAQIEALTHVAEKHTGRLAGIDTRIEGLLAAGERNAVIISELAAQVEKTSQAIANLERQWQAYVNTLPRQ